MGLEVKIGLHEALKSNAVPHALLFISRTNLLRRCWTLLATSCPGQRRRMLRASANAFSYFSIGSNAIILRIKALRLSGSRSSTHDESITTASKLEIWWLQAARLFLTASIR